MNTKYVLFALTHVFGFSLLVNACSTLPTKSYTDLESFQDSLAVGGFGPKLVVIPAGRFLMGSLVEKGSIRPTEQPTHEVSFNKPFAIGKYELTFADYDAFVKATGYSKPSDLGWGTKYWGRGKTPVFNVSWHDAQRYLEWLSLQTGAKYRLPSEAEWEYAARAATRTIYHTGDCINAEQANFHDKEPYANCKPSGAYRGKVIKTGSFPPNPWGLHDVHGNILEWTQDCWHENYNDAPSDGSTWLTENNGNCDRRVLRGGSWSGRAVELRSSARTGNLIDQKSIFIGFRVMRELN